MAISFSVSYTFSPSTTISSSQVNTNFSDNAGVWQGIEAKTKTFSNLGVDTELKTGGSLLTANGTVAAPSVAFTNSAGSGMYRIGADDIGIATAGVIGLEINNAQAVIIRGVATNSTAAAGMVGEQITASLIRSAPQTIVTNTSATVTSISLTAGDWYVVGEVGYNGAGTISQIQASISKTSATLSALDTVCVPTSGEVRVLSNGLAATDYTAPPCIARVLLASTTTIYLVAQATFTVTQAAFGSITATRTR